MSNTENTEKMVLVHKKNIIVRYGFVALLVLMFITAKMDWLNIKLDSGLQKILLERAMVAEPEIQDPDSTEHVYLIDADWLSEPTTKKAQNKNIDTEAVIAGVLADGVSITLHDYVKLMNANGEAVKIEVLSYVVFIFYILAAVLAFFNKGFFSAASALVGCILNFVFLKDFLYFGYSGNMDYDLSKLMDCTLAFWIYFILGIGLTVYAFVYFFSMEWSAIDWKFAHRLGNKDVSFAEPNWECPACGKSNRGYIKICMCGKEKDSDTQWVYK